MLFSNPIRALIFLISLVGFSNAFGGVIHKRVAAEDGQENNLYKRGSPVVKTTQTVTCKAALLSPNLNPHKTN
jgi:hypothetical protein